MKRASVQAALKLLLIGFVLFRWAVLPMYAQDARTVTDDDVNRLASRLYCPVCPNETLDACRTEACAQWRAEIRVQLEAGATDQQVIDNFIARFGQRVIGTPQDPTLRALAIGTPIVITGAAVILGVYTFLRWQRRSSAAPTETEPSPSAGAVPGEGDGDDAYRDLIERDLQ